MLCITMNFFNLLILLSWVLTTSCNQNMQPFSNARSLKSCMLKFPSSYCWIRENTCEFYWRHVLLLKEQLSFSINDDVTLLYTQIRYSVACFIAILQCKISLLIASSLKQFRKRLAKILKQILWSAFFFLSINTQMCTEILLLSNYSIRSIRYHFKMVSNGKAEIWKSCKLIFFIILRVVSNKIN